MLVGIGRVVLLGHVVEHQDVRQRLESVREIPRNVDGPEVVVADVFAESLACVTVERDNARPALQADEEVVLAALVVVQAADRPLP